MKVPPERQVAKRKYLLDVGPGYKRSDPRTVLTMREDIDFLWEQFLSELCAAISSHLRWERRIIYMASRDPTIRRWPWITNLASLSVATHSALRLQSLGCFLNLVPYPCSLEVAAGLLRD